MKPAMWLTRALSKALGTYSLCTAEKHTAVVKRRKAKEACLAGKLQRGSHARVVRVVRVVGKTWGSEDLGMPPLRGNQQCWAKRGNQKHIAPRVFGWPEPWY